MQIVTRRKQIGWNDEWVKEHAKIRVFINPFTLKSDIHLISPHNITPESNIMILRIQEIITN